MGVLNELVVERNPEISNMDVDNKPNSVIKSKIA